MTLCRSGGVKSLKYIVVVYSAGLITQRSVVQISLQPSSHLLHGRRLGEHRRWSQSGHKTVATLTGLKRLASAVQLCPWPPHFKAVSGIASCPPSPLSGRHF